MPRMANEATVIILEIDHLVKTLMEKINRLAFLVPELSEIITMVFESIAHEDDAAIELAYASMEVVKDALHSEMEQDVAITAEAVIVFGEGVLRELQKFGAYKNGQLLHRFHGWLGDDLVLSVDDEVIQHRLYALSDPHRVLPDPDDLLERYENKSTT